MENSYSALVKSRFVGTYTTISSDVVRIARNAPYLERAEEEALTLRWTKERDDQALHVIMAAHMRLILSMARKFRHYGLPLEDIVQEGCVGLLDAASRFDIEREVRFSSYASWWIRAAMQDYVLKNWSIVRGGTSSAQKALFFKLRRMRAKMLSTGVALSKSETYEKIAAELGVSKNDVETMDFRLATSDYSLNVTPSDDENHQERQDFLVDTRPLQDEIVESQIDGSRRSSWLKQALSVLNSREYEVIMRRRLSEEGETLENLGHKMGVSKERIRQIESRALEKLRQALTVEHQELAIFV